MTARGTRPAARTLAALALVAGLTTVLTGCQTGTPEEPAPGQTTVAPEPEETEAPSETEAPQETEAPDETEPPADTSGAVNGPNSITFPTQGETVTSPFTATGEGTAFEATLNYRVLIAGSEEEAVGVTYTMAGANGEVGPWSVDLALEPGAYTLQVWEPDVSDGESGSGPYVNLVEVTFTVS